MHQTIEALISHADPDKVAICAPNRADLNYDGLRDQCRYTADFLADSDIGPEDCVAILLPNGPEMAVSFVAVASCCTAAPLNPAYREEELLFYLGDLQASAIIVHDEADSAAIKVANQLGIRILFLNAGVEAGRFQLSIPDGQETSAKPGGKATAESIALILHTSGTTSRPKMVPLSQLNLCCSAQNIAASLRLGSNDRCLNVMPLFHIHGLLACVLSSLSAGASIYCTPGFNALRFFSSMQDASPSWYSAVPTMHQAITARAGRQPEIIQANPLRFIRSSSASLAPQILDSLRETFNCPVIEAYGMTEAAHQMAANPLPPAQCKPGTVGLAAGPEVAIMDEKGALLASGGIGEIVIRGDNVTTGYRNNDEANATAFTNGWFRTGDQGTMDADGYITITGRLKEIINRGGEKISPREIDEILLDHPAVVQAVTFALPHDKLGEDVAAAVILAEGESVEPSDIQAFVRSRIADFKVPRKIVLLDEIPKGATGKLQRIGLAEKLGLV